MRLEKYNDEKVNSRLKKIHYRLFSYLDNGKIQVYLGYESYGAPIGVVRYDVKTGNVELLNEILYFSFNLNHIKKIVDVLKEVEYEN